MGGYPYVDCDQCQFGDYGYQKPTRFFGSDRLRFLESVRCDQRTCPWLEEDPEGSRRRRRHINHQGGHNGFVQKELAYRLPPTLVEYVSVLADRPDPRCKPRGNLDYAVQRGKVLQIVETLMVEPSVDAFRTASTPRF